MNWLISKSAKDEQPRPQRKYPKFSMSAILNLREDAKSLMEMTQYEANAKLQTDQISLVIAIISVLLDHPYLPTTNTNSIPKNVITIAIKEYENMIDDPIKIIDMYVTFFDVFDNKDVAFDRIYYSIKNILGCSDTYQFAESLSQARNRIMIASFVVRYAVDTKSIPEFLALFEPVDIDYAISRIFVDCMNNIKHLAKISAKYVRRIGKPPKIDEYKIMLSGETYDVASLAYTPNHDKFFKEHRNNEWVAKLLLEYALGPQDQRLIAINEIPNIALLSHQVVWRSLRSIEREHSALQKANMVRLYVALGDYGFDDNIIAERIQPWIKDSQLLYDDKISYVLAYYIMLSRLNSPEIRISELQFDSVVAMRGICMPLRRGKVTICKKLYKKYCVVLENDRSD